MFDHVLNSARDHVTLSVYEFLLYLGTAELPWYSRHLLAVILEYRLIFLHDFFLILFSLLFLYVTSFKVVHLELVQLICQ